MTNVSITSTHINIVCAEFCKNINVDKSNLEIITKVKMCLTPSATCYDGCIECDNDNESICKIKCADYKTYFACNEECVDVKLKNSQMCFMKSQCTKKCEEKCRKFWPGMQNMIYLFIQKILHQTRVIHTIPVSYKHLRDNETPEHSG